MTSTSAIGSFTDQTAATTSVDRKDQLGQDTFLKLLVAQLKYQNPLQPQDGTEFLSQTAQFTQLEKLTELNTQTASMMASQQAVGAASLVGKTVKADIGQPDLYEGVVTSVKFGTDGLVLRVGDNDVLLKNVKEVIQA